MNKKNVFLLILFVGLSLYKSNTLLAQDVTMTASNVYKLLSDTLGIRMFEATFTPGAKAAFHTHPDHAVYVLEGGMLDIFDAKGVKTTIEVKAGMSLILEGDSHTAINPGKSTVRAIVIEIHRPRK